MDEPTSPGSPSRDGSMKKSSSNPLSKLLFRRKGSNSSLSPSSRRDDNGDDTSGHEVVERGLNEEEDKDPSLVEEVKEVVENLEHSIHGLFHHHHHKKENSPEQSVDATSSVDSSRDSSFNSESTKGHRRHRFLNKVKHGLDKAKEEYGKAKDELKAIVGKDKSHHGYAYDPPHVKYSDSDSDSSNEEKRRPSVDDDEVKIPTLAQKLQEEEALEASNRIDTIQEQVVEAPKIIAQSIQEEAPKITQTVQEEAPKIAQTVQEEVVAKAPKIGQSIQEENVKAPNIAQRIQEEVVAVISTIDEAKKNKTTPAEPSKASAEPSKDVVQVEKKEDNCITSLAQGLQSLCSWGKKKED